MLQIQADSSSYAVAIDTLIILFEGKKIPKLEIKTIFILYQFAFCSLIICHHNARSVPQGQTIHNLLVK